MPHRPSNTVLRYRRGNEVQDYLGHKPLSPGDPITVKINGDSHEATLSLIGPDRQRCICIDDACFPLDDDILVRRPAPR